jgi:hypothetical protein
MVESNVPSCPVCKVEVLLPFSASQEENTKDYAHWVCTNCGFCIGTGDTKGTNPKDDIKTEILQNLVKEIERKRLQHRTQKV